MCINTPILLICWFCAICCASSSTFGEGTPRTPNYIPTYIFYIYIGIIIISIPFVLRFGGYHQQSTTVIFIFMLLVCLSCIFLHIYNKFINYLNRNKDNKIAVVNMPSSLTYK